MSRIRDVFLFGDDGSETVQAEQLLNAHQIRWMKTDLRHQPQPGMIAPTIITPIGTLCGLEGIEYYIDDLRRFPDGL